jgi:nucleotide-binding universal stress UspA family protein
MNSILVPIDFSETSENALKYAVSIANYLSFKIVLLHVDSMPLMNNEFQDVSFIVNKSREEYLELLKSKALQLKKDLVLNGSIEYFSATGELKSTIESFISEHNIDYVVMGITGCDSAITQFLLGSNAVSLSKDINVPLFIIPKKYHYKLITKMVYACQLDVKDPIGIAKVKALNAVFGSSLFVLHVIPNDHFLSKKESDIEYDNEQKLEQVDHQTYVVQSDDVSEAIIDFIGTNDIDLVIMEQRDYSFLEKIVHVSETKRLSFKSPIPIITFHN